MATIKDIADIVNVSQGTVSKALNGASDVGEELRNKILDTAVSIGYTTKKMRNSQSWNLCVFIENMEYGYNQFGYEIILGFKQLAARDNCKVDIINITEEIQQAEKYDNYMIKHGYRGGFFVGFSLHDPWFKDIGNTTIPTVLLDNVEERNSHVAYIGTDSYEGFERAINYLHNLGHENIALLNGSAGSMITNSRGHAFRKACKKYKVNYNGLIENGDYTENCAKNFVSDFIKNGATAIMCSSDLIAMGVLTECTKLGYKVPDDISVIGFDDLPLSVHLTPPLTTIRQERGELGKQGYLTLYSLINGVHISQTLLRPEFIIRQSTAEVKKII